jgi:glycosyltransferase involved in cell wall biosynthesis
MRVLFIAGWQTPYGDFIKEHCKAVSKFNEVYYAYINFNKTLKGFPYKIDIKEETHDDIHFFNVEVNCYLRRFGVYEKLVKLAFNKVLKRINLPFDIVHVNVRTPETEIIALSNEINYLPKILTEHSSFYHTGIYRSFSGEKLHNERNRIINWFKNANFSKVIVVSDFLGNVLNKNFKISTHKLVKVANTVSEIYNFESKPISEKINICLIAYWRIPKNPMMFVKALNLIDDSLKSKITVNWIGEGEQLTEVKQFVNSKLKNIQINFIGPVYEKEELASYLKKADLFVHPTDAENLPCVIIESLCCGTPVLSNMVGGVPELINESNGILVEPNNPEKFAAAFQKIIDNLSNYDNKKISESAVNIYSYNNVGRSITKIYQNYLV